MVKQRTVPITYNVLYYTKKAAQTNALTNSSIKGGLVWFKQYQSTVSLRPCSLRQTLIVSLVFSRGPYLKFEINFLKFFHLMVYQIALERCVFIVSKLKFSVSIRTISKAQTLQQCFKTIELIWTFYMKITFLFQIWVQCWYVITHWLQRTVWWERKPAKITINTMRRTVRNKKTAETVGLELKTSNCSTNTRVQTFVIVTGPTENHGNQKQRTVFVLMT